MSVRQTQFAYDDDWHNRKEALKKRGIPSTWKIIMERGIEALENEIENKIIKDVFEIKVNNVSVDILENNKWVKLIDRMNTVNGDIVRFRTDNEIQSINGKKRFELCADPSKEKDDSIIYTLKK